MRSGVLLLFVLVVAPNGAVTCAGARGIEPGLP